MGQSCQWRHKIRSNKPCTKSPTFAGKKLTCYLKNRLNLSCPMHQISPSSSKSFKLSFQTRNPLLRVYVSIEFCPEISIIAWRLNSGSRRSGDISILVWMWSLWFTYSNLFHIYILKCGQECSPVEKQWQGSHETMALINSYGLRTDLGENKSRTTHI